MFLQKEKGLEVSRSLCNLLSLAIVVLMDTFQNEKIMNFRGCHQYKNGGNKRKNPWCKEENK